MHNNEKAALTGGAKKIPLTAVAGAGKYNSLFCCIRTKNIT